MEGLIYSPRQHIPLFKLIRDDQGDTTVEYRNTRTSRTEQMKVEPLVIYLLEAEMISRRKKGMIYSPKQKIPIGMMNWDELSDTCYIEVKYKHKKERIRFTTYISLLLESKARKAK